MIEQNKALDTELRIGRHCNGKFTCRGPVNAVVTRVKTPDFCACKTVAIAEYLRVTMVALADCCAWSVICGRDLLDACGNWRMTENSTGQIWSVVAARPMPAAN